MKWILFRKGEAIPKELLYDGYQTDRSRDDYTPLMLWIRDRSGEPIPDCLLYEGC